VYICLTNRVYPDDGKTYGVSKVNIRAQVLDSKENIGTTFTVYLTNRKNKTCLAAGMGQWVPLQIFYT